MPNVPEPLMTAKEVAALLRVSAQTVSRWADEGNLSPVTLPGRVLRFRRVDIEAMLDPERASA